MAKMRYYCVCAAVGLVWGLLVARPFAGLAHTLRGGILASPAIGVVIGALFSRFNAYTIGVRSILSLISLFTAAVLFGLAAGTGALVVPRGLLLTGYFLILWPLAYLTHRLVARFAS